MWNSKISLRTKGLYDDIKFNSISFEWRSGWNGSFIKEYRSKKENKSTVWHFGIYLDFPVLLFFLQLTHMTKKKVQSLSAVFYASACERNLLGWWRVPSNDKEKLSYICCTNAMWALKIWLKRSKTSWRVISNAVKPFE